MPECNKCGRSFDSERGLHVHQSQVHDSEESFNTNLSLKSPRPWILAVVIVIVGILFLEATGYPEVPITGTSEAEEGQNEEFSRELKIKVVNENQSTEDNVTVNKEGNDASG